MLSRVGVSAFLSLVGFGVAAAVPNLVKCPVVLDGRIPAGTPLTFFDTSNTLFNPDFVKGNNLKWSQILQLPNATASRFDAAGGNIPVEVTISDASIFMTQNGFRRAGLQFAADSANDASDTGIKTIHFSVKQDPQRKLNLTHEYLNVWHETAAFDANQFNFEIGTIIGTNGADKSSFKILGRANNNIFTVASDPVAWQNFAVKLDYSQNTLQVFYSKNNDPLKAVTSAVANNNAGGGQFQIGMLKKPTGTADVANSGFQESGINEGQIYGGLFVEDSANGCISL